ncbi:MAG: hypothetical protein KKC30_15620 [Proteobacteria bacterium]|nr:hypothetical protein [Pseudomonadota bacterium]MBU4381561.1 hypothetical protein [Pseudomonadota bacterium]MCG2766547.1 hypothetical protein [Desulfarculaceae bacterium]
MRPAYNVDLYSRDHPTEADNVYPLVLKEANLDGLGRVRYLIGQDAVVETPAGVIAVQALEIDGVIELVVRGENNGAVLQLTRNGVLNAGPPAAITGCLPAWVSSSSFTLGSGALDIGGAPYEIPATLTKSGQSGFSANAWLYLKAAAPAPGNELTAGEISLDATAPSWSDTYKAWYIGTERVIGVLRSDGAGNLANFFCDGRSLNLTASINFLATSSPSTSDTAIPTGLPPLGALMWFGLAYIGQSNAQEYQVWMTPAPATSGNGHLIFDTINSPGSYSKAVLMFADSSQQVTYKAVWNGSGSVYVYLNGFFLPAGMAR